MENIDLKKVVEERISSYFEKWPPFVSKLVFTILTRILKINDVTDFMKRYQDRIGLDFIDALFDYLNFSYSISSLDRAKIPSEGKLVVVSNHPLGALDGLALVKAINDVRPDVKIIANDILMNIGNLKSLMLPYDVFSLRAQKNHIKQIEQTINADEAVIFFPAAEVSRFGIKGINDGKWHKGAVNFASKFQAPVLPVFVKARNSLLFYFISLLYKRLSTFMLPHELFRKTNKTITIKIGDPIPGESFTKSIFSKKTLTKLLKKHTYRIGKNKKRIFNTEKTIIHPVSRRQIKKDLSESEMLGETKDGKKIYLCEYFTAESVMKEISRLREQTFRKVGEGTGKRCDTDRFDRYYKHLVLWDEDQLEIVGSYRIGIGREILESHGIEGFYNNNLFYIHEKFSEILENSIELGRSFVQQKYWRSSALDYLWQGIGAFLAANPSNKYLLGAVSISDSYSREAKNMIVYYYKKWYSAESELVTSRYNFSISKMQEEGLREIFNGDNLQQDFRTLKMNLKALGYSIPVLYRRYTDICEYGGVSFLDFCVDKDFSNSIDGLCLLNLDMIKDSYKARYFNQKSFLKSEKNLLS